MSVVLVALLAACGDDASPSGSQDVTPTAPASAPAVLTVPPPTATSTSVPPFVGTLNGLAIDPSWRGRTPLELCPSGTMAQVPPGRAETVTRAVGPLRIDPSRLPAGTVSVVTPDAFLCDGALAQVSWALRVPTPQATPSAPVFISRIRGLEPIQQAAPKSAWQAIAIKGHAGVGFAGTDSPAGHCWVGLYDDSSDVFTTVSAERGGTLTPCIDIASALID